MTRSSPTWSLARNIFLSKKRGKTDFVLYEPPLKGTTVLLWAGPALLILGGFAGLVRLLATRRAAPAAPELSPEERQRAERLLAGSEDSIG